MHIAVCLSASFRDKRGYHCGWRFSDGRASKKARKSKKKRNKKRLLDNILYITYLYISAGLEPSSLYQPTHRYPRLVCALLIRPSLSFHLELVSSTTMGQVGRREVNVIAISLNAGSASVIGDGPGQCIGLQRCWWHKL